MPRLRLLLDTNILIDCLNRREPYFESARLMMIIGQVGEFSLWMSASQVDTLIYILSEDGRKSLIPEVLERLRRLRTFVNVCPVEGADIDRMLATTWDDPEDALLYDLAVKMRADALVTRDRNLPRAAGVRVFTCDELFAWISDEFGIDYAEVAL